MTFPWQDTLHELRKLNPERHGRDNTTMCYVCGNLGKDGHVLCEKHLADFDKVRETGAVLVDWVLDHSDFNGVHPVTGVWHHAGMYPARPNAEQMYEILRQKDAAR